MDWVKQIGSFLFSFIGGSWKTSLIFGVIGLVASPFIFKIIKSMIENTVAEYKHKKAIEDTDKQSQKDFIDKIKSNDSQNKVTQDDAASSESDKQKAINKLKEKSLQK